LILLINTIDRNKIEIGIYQNNELHSFKFETKTQSEDILPIISVLLKKQKLSTGDISAIMVHEGPGSYTGVRIGIVTGNTLAWSLNKPVLSYNDKNLLEVINKIIGIKTFSDIALPVY
jgi:tRNA threonylcarbamoyl adenosine modification protein YeaZ